MVLGPRGPLLERGDVPERQTTREVDDSQQGAIRTHAHAEYAVLDVTNADTKLLFIASQILSIELFIII